MKQIDKKDMPKLIALIVFALGLFGFAAFQILAPQPAPAAPAVAKDKGGEAATPSGPIAGPTVAAAATVADLATVTLMETGRDPFLPSGPAAPKDPLAIAPIAPIVPIAVSAPVGKASELERLLGLKNKTGRPGGLADVMDSINGGPGGAAGTAVTPFVLPAAPPPAYVLTGVVTSEGAGRHSPNSVAILRGGMGETAERRFVKIGDEIGNGYRVVAIFASGIDIKSGSRTITLNMGAPKTQNNNGSAPATTTNAAGVTGNVITSSNGGATVAAPAPASIAAGK